MRIPLKHLAVISLLIYGLACIVTGIDHQIAFLGATLIAGIAGFEIGRKKR